MAAPIAAVMLTTRIMMTESEAVKMQNLLSVYGRQVDHSGTAAAVYTKRKQEIEKVTIMPGVFDGVPEPLETDLYIVFADHIRLRSGSLSLRKMNVGNEKTKTERRKSAWQKAHTQFASAHEP